MATRGNGAPAGAFSHWWWAPSLRPDGLPADAPPADHRAWWQRPWFRFILHALVLATTIFVPMFLITSVWKPTEDEGFVLFAAVSAVAAVISLWIGAALEGRRHPIETSLRRSPGLLIGIAIGAGISALAFLIIWASGSAKFEGATPGYDYLGSVLVFGLHAAIVEEFVYRWLLFRLSEEYLGTWFATLLSGVVFGAMHVSDPSSDLLVGVAIGLEAGILLAVLYTLTRSLWVVCGLHFAWNMVQCPLLGLPDDGPFVGGWLGAKLDGPAWLTGGEFGMETSLIAIGLCLAVASWAALHIHRRGLAVQPIWRR